MIIKRRVTRQFVQIANEVVRDRTITLDAHGMLHYLLSLPNDWEINLRQIETFWSIGKTKRQRIFNELAHAGWLKYEKMQDDGGGYVGSRWIVGDEPVAPGAAEIEAIEEDGEPLVATKPDPEEVSGPASLDDRERGLAAAAFVGSRDSRQPQNPPVPARRNSSDEEIDSTNTKTEVVVEGREEPDGLPPPPFGSFLRLWPRDNIASTFACEKVFHNLTDKQKADAVAAAKTYLDDCRGKGQTRLCDLKTYLVERRWERFTQRGIRGTNSFFMLKAGMPETERWRNHYREFEPSKLKFFEHQMRIGASYAVPAQWPPARPSSLSEQDHHALANL